jgi:hypothetical protein
MQIPSGDAASTDPSWWWLYGGQARALLGEGHDVGEVEKPSHEIRLGKKKRNEGVKVRSCKEVRGSEK